MPSTPVVLPATGCCSCSPAAGHSTGDAVRWNEGKPSMTPAGPYDWHWLEHGQALTPVLSGPEGSTCTLQWFEHMKAPSLLIMHNVRRSLVP